MEVVNKQANKLAAPYSLDLSPALDKSLASFEGLEQENHEQEIHEHEKELKSIHANTEQKHELSRCNYPESKSEKENLLTRKGFVRDTLPVIGYISASIFHFIAALGKAKSKMPTALVNFTDKFAPSFSKTVNSLNFLAKAFEAFKMNRSLEAIARILYPIGVLPSKLENIFMNSGYSSAATMLEYSLKHKVKDESSFWNNLCQNRKAYGKMLKEIISAGFGKGRRIFVGKNDKDKGHSMFFSSHIIMLGTLMGLFTGHQKSALFTLASGIRNIGGILADYAKMLEDDSDMKIAGGAFFAVSGMDFTQAAMSNKDNSHWLSHIVQAANNVANFFYAKPTSNRTDKLA